MKRVNSKNNVKKICLSMLIIILLLSISIGYAYLTRQLQINGLTKIESNTWNVRWSRIADEKVGRKAQIISPAKITSSVEGKNLDDIINFEVKLDKPGDYYEVKLYRENAGSIDAKLDSYSVTGLDNTENYLEFSIIDPDGDESLTDENGVGNLMSNPLLPHGLENYITLRLYFKEDITVDDLLDEANNLNVSIKLNYIQDLG